MDFKLLGRWQVAQRSLFSPRKNSGRSPLLPHAGFGAAALVTATGHVRLLTELSVSSCPPHTAGLSLSGCPPCDQEGCRRNRSPEVGGSLLITSVSPVPSLWSALRVLSDSRWHAEKCHLGDDGPSRVQFPGLYPVGSSVVIISSRN